MDHFILQHFKSIIILLSNELSSISVDVYENRYIEEIGSQLSFLKGTNKTNAASRWKSQAFKSTMKSYVAH